VFEACVGVEHGRHAQGGVAELEYYCVAGATRYRCGGDKARRSCHHVRVISASRWRRTPALSGILIRKVPSSANELCMIRITMRITIPAAENPDTVMALGRVVYASVARHVVAAWIVADLRKECHWS